MHNRALIIALAIFSAAPAVAETYKLEAYYPSPAGIYTNLTVTSSTVLSRDGGGTKIGTPAHVSNLEVFGTIGASGVVIPGRLASDPTMPSQLVEGAIYFNTTTKSHKVYRNAQWIPLAGTTEMLGAEDGYAGQTGTQACQKIGLRCSRVVSNNFILQDAGCPGATHCLHICATYYNQGLPGVQNGGDHDNIHSCNARLGNYTTYLHSGVVRCNAFFSAICVN